MTLVEFTANFCLGGFFQGCRPGSVGPARTHSCFCRRCYRQRYSRAARPINKRQNYCVFIYAADVAAAINELNRFDYFLLLKLIQSSIIHRRHPQDFYRFLALTHFPWNLKVNNNMLLAHVPVWYNRCFFSNCMTFNCLIFMEFQNWILFIVVQNAKINIHRKPVPYGCG